MWHEKGDPLHAGIFVIVIKIKQNDFWFLEMANSDSSMLTCWNICDLTNILTRNAQM